MFNEKCHKLAQCLISDKIRHSKYSNHAMAD